MNATVPAVDELDLDERCAQCDARLPLDAHVSDDCARCGHNPEHALYVAQALAATAADVFGDDNIPF